MLQIALPQLEDTGVRTVVVQWLRLALVYRSATGNIWLIIISTATTRFVFGGTGYGEAPRLLLFWNGTTSSDWNYRNYTWFSLARRQFLFYFWTG